MNALDVIYLNDICV